MRASFSIGKVLGIPIRINYTWFLIVVLATLLLATDVLPRDRDTFPALVYWVAGALGSLLFFASVLAHELAHSVVAKAQGLPVRDITLFLFGGVASIEREADRPLKELAMSGVGPVTSLLLALLFAIPAFALNLISPAGTILSLVSRVALALASVNLGLAIFNMLPGLPLDGGRVLRAVVWQITGNYRQATAAASIAGRVISFLLIGGGILLALSGDWTSGIWLALIGWFMENAAGQSYQMVILQEALRQARVSDLMTAECARVPRGLAVSELVDQYILSQGGRCFAVTDGETLSGLVTVHNVRQLPRERWPFTPVGEIMVPYSSLVRARPHEDGWTVLQRMDRHSVNQIPVEEEGRLLGMLTRENLLRYVRARLELGM